MWMRFLFVCFQYFCFFPCFFLPILFFLSAYLFVSLFVSLMHLGAVKSHALLMLHRLTFVSQLQLCDKKMYFQRKHTVLICWLYILKIVMQVFDKATDWSCYLLSRQQPSSQTTLSAPCCNTSQGDWQANRWDCHMFLKEPAKMFSPISKQMRLFFFSKSMPHSLSLHSLLNPFGSETWLVTCLSGSTEKWQT